MTAFGAPSPTPRDALAFFVQARREFLVRELTHAWGALGRAEVEDAVDEAVAQAAAAMTATREQAVYDYVRTAAYRLLNRRKRGAGRTTNESAEFDRLVAATLGPDDALIAKENRQLIVDVAASLDDRTRTILRLKHVEGLERKAVANQLGISEKAVKKAIEKGHRICRELYSDTDNLCGHRRLALDALISGRASDGERQAAEAHLRHCERCRSYKRTIQAAGRAAAILPPVSAAGKLGDLLSRLTKFLSCDRTTTSVLAAPAAKVAAVLAIAATATAVGTARHGGDATHNSHPSPRRATTQPARWADPPVVHTQPTAARPASAHRRRPTAKKHERTHETSAKQRPAVAPVSPPATPLSSPKTELPPHDAEGDEFPIF